MRGRFRFGLRMFLVMCCVPAVAIYVGFAFHRARERTHAIAEIENGGGVIAYQHQIDMRSGGMSGPPESPPDVPGPRVLRGVLGDAYFLQVAEVDYTICHAGNVALKLAPLRCLTEVHSLILEACNVTNAELEHLGQLSHLLELDLGWTAVDDEGMEHLAELHSLKRLNLQHTPVTDVGLRHLSKLRELEYLSLNHTSVSDAGLRHLSELCRLVELDVAWTHVTGTGLSALSPSLTSIRLNHSPASDSSVSSLGRFSSLERLMLCDTRVTDDICPRLTNPQMSLVDLSWTFVTEKGATAIKTRLPNVHVIIETRFSDEDVAAIHKVVSARPDCKGHIQGFSRVSDTQVEVHTGVNRGTLNGEGLSYTLEKSDGNWEVIAVTGWVS